MSMRARGNSLAAGWLSGHLLFNWIWVDELPVLLHADNYPAFGDGFVEGLIELADLGITVVGVFALGIVVVDKQGQALAAAGHGVLEHLQVAIGIAEGSDGAAA